MDSFLFSLSTRILADDSVPALRHAADILRRDMRDGLTHTGAENTIRVCLDPTLAKETFKAHVTKNEITLRCGDDLGAAYALLSVSERLLPLPALTSTGTACPSRSKKNSISREESSFL